MGCANLGSFTKSLSLFEQAIVYRDSVALVWPGHARAFFVRDSLAWIGADMRTAARSDQLNIDGVEGLDGFEAEIPHRLMQ